MKKFILYIFLIANVHTLMAQSMQWLFHPGRFSNIQYMGYDLFKVMDNSGKWGVFSAEGKELIKCQIDSITPFVENRALILDKSGHKIIGILDYTGEIIKSFENDSIFTTAYPYYKEGLLSYKDKNNLCGYINYQGEISIKARFYLAAPFQNGIATVQYADDGYYGLINKSGNSAIISDIKYKFLSSIVDGYLMAVTTSIRGGDILRIMKLDVNKLKAAKTLEKKMFVDLSDDFTYLTSQNGHHYFIDNQWRISGANYKFVLPYKITDNLTFITECSELLSKQKSEDGIQITYLGRPILEHIFDDVETYEKKYAIVSAKDKTIGVLKLNPSAGIELIEPTQVFVFNHNRLPSDLSNNLEGTDLIQYIEVQVDIKDVNPAQLKCYINKNGYLQYAPLKQRNGTWKLQLPYFHPDTQFNNIVSNEIDIAITYDGLDWMHRLVNVSTKHEPGYDIQITGNNETNNNGIGQINIIVQSIKGISDKPVRIDISGQKTVYLKDYKTVIPITVNNIPEGASRTFTYSVAVSEEGCPTMTKTVSKTITYPKQIKPEKKIEPQRNSNEEKKEEKREIKII